MFKKLSLVGVVGAIALLVFFWLKPESYKNFPPTVQGDWIAFGDSLTSGVGASGGNDYPSLLSQRLGIRIHNFGIPGNTTSDGLNRMNQTLQLQPKVVLLCLGGNDGLRSLPKEEMFSNLSALIDAFQQVGSFVVLIGVHSASLRDTNSDGFEKLAKEKEVFYVPDILDGVLGSPSLMSDHIHPNDAGYQKIAERIEDVLRPLLSQLN